MPKKDLVELIRFVLESSDQQPVHRRVTLYRGLANICGDETEAKQLTTLADELEKADARCAEFIFSFSQQNRH